MLKSMRSGGRGPRAPFTEHELSQLSAGATSAQMAGVAAEVDAGDMLRLVAQARAATGLQKKLTDGALRVLGLLALVTVSAALIGLPVGVLIRVSAWVAGF